MFSNVTTKKLNLCHREWHHTAKALLEKQETQHPECQRLYRWCIEGCGLTENHLLELNDFLSRSVFLRRGDLHLTMEQIAALREKRPWFAVTIERDACSIQQFVKTANCGHDTKL